MQMITTTLRNSALDAFHKEFKIAQRMALIARIKKQAAILPKIAEEAPMFQYNKCFSGIKAIPTQHIMGTVGRDGDFDLDFRPLKKHLQDRWVNAFILAKTQPCTPIRAYKQGEQYFVEDGHHRVSVARHLGMDFIDAEVWEIPEEGEKAIKSNPLPPALRLSSARVSCQQS